MRRLLTSLLALFTALQAPLAAAGKVDVGAMAMWVDIVNDGTKVRNLDLQGLAANGTIQVYEALVVKPSFMLAEGQANYVQAGMNVGAYIPVGDSFSITPSAGGSWGWLSTTIDIPIYNLHHVTQRFDSRAGNIAVDLSYKITPCIMLSGTIQYAWTHSDTTVGSSIVYSSEARGFNYIAMIDYFITEKISINLTGAVQESRDKERHGSDARGLRLGMGFMF